MFKKRRYGFGLYIAGWAELKNNLLAFQQTHTFLRKAGGAAVADPPGTKGDGFADIVVIATFSRMDGKRKIGEIRIMKQCFKFRQRDCRFRTGQIKPGNTDILIGNSQLGSLLILSRASRLRTYTEECRSGS